MSFSDGFLVAALLSIWTGTLLHAVPLILRRMGLFRPNFRDEIIPTAYGIFILLWLIPAFLFWCLQADDKRAALANLLLVIGFGSLGFLDDRWGDRRYSGLRGHFGALLKERVVTSGLLKAVGGVFIGFTAAIAVGVTGITAILICAAIIALSANLLNLLDLRPGRSGAFFILLTIPILIAAPANAWGLILTLIPAILVYVQDARARVMMGDTGSNLLGGMLGLGFVLAVNSLPIRLAVVAALLSIHLIAEKVSLSSLIDRIPLLRRLDSLTGVR